MSVPSEDELRRVPGAEPARETLFPMWEWVEHTVWTERMLTAGGSAHLDSKAGIEGAEAAGDSDGS
jgi:hypothetical protein